MTEPTGRDRLKELLEAVLATALDDAPGPVDGPAARRLGQMAGEAFASPWHFSRRLARATGEPPVALRRRVLLERAAWQLAGGARVTDAAIAAGYDSVDGFGRAYARAYGHPPSTTPPDPSPAAGRHWLPAPNGIHFHPPTNLWVTQTVQERPAMELIAHLVHHDVADTGHLVELAARLPEEQYRRARLPGHVLLAWDGPEESVAAVLDRLVGAKEVWLAAIEGTGHPARGGDDPGALRARHEGVAPRWLAAVRDIERRGAWGDTLVDALCDPPESFLLSSVVAHVLTFAAHRRQLVRTMLRDAGAAVDAGDPIDWLRGTTGAPPTAKERP